MPCLDPFRSPNDQNHYRVIVLENGLQVLLIQSPSNGQCGPSESDASTVCMSVGVGSYSDPHHLPGLAHYLEHMLFMGTEAFPGENALEAFLSSHGGSSNGSTDCETTQLYYTVETSCLEESLKMFSQCFISPMFHEDSMRGELEAIQAEFSLAMQRDTARLQQVQAETCVEGHRYRTFGWGNKESLDVIPLSAGVSVRDSMIQFFKTHYVSDNMKLCVHGSHDLADMETWVRSSFSGINTAFDSLDVSLTPLPIENPPFGIFASQKPTLVHVIPRKNTHTMHLYWQLPCLFDAYRMKPWKYIAHILEHEGPGSLTSVLKLRGLATSLGAGIDESDGYEFGSFGSIFDIRISLTRVGVDAWETIARLVFECLHTCVTRAGFHRWIADEMNQMADINFRFQQEEEPIQICRELSQLMLSRYRVLDKDLLGYEFFHENFGMEDIEALLQWMTPENTRVVVLSQSFQDDSTWPERSKKERWFQVKYHISEIPSLVIASFHACEGVDSGQFRLPERNPYIPRHLNSMSASLSLEKDDLIPTRHPELIYTSGRSKLWFKLAEECKTPRIKLCYAIHSPVLALSSKNAALAELYLGAVNSALASMQYQANMAGFEVGIDLNDHDIHVIIQGYNDSPSIESLLHHIFDSLLRLSSFSEDDYAMLRDKLHRDYQNRLIVPSFKARYLRLQLLERANFTVESLIASLSSLTLEDLISFPERVFCDDSTVLRVLIHGNTTEIWAVESTHMVESKLIDINSIPKQVFPPTPKRLHVTELPLTHNGWMVREFSDTEDESNNAVELYYQLASCIEDKGTSSESSLLPQETAYAELLHQVMKEPIFHELRTKKQLGYEICCCVRDTHGILGFSILVQSAAFASGEIATCIDEFVQMTFHQILSEYTSQQFESECSMLLQKMKQDDESFDEKTFQYWEEIINKRYDFSFRFRVASAIGNCTLNGLLERYRMWFLHSDSVVGIRKLRVHVVGRNAHRIVPLESLVPAHAVPHIIEDLDHFKRCHARCYSCQRTECHSHHPRSRDIKPAGEL
uniref:Nardilysinlike protein putative n=1 Tax=Albugo laibachii Nc14 TaxID=890382 RepID=F0W1C7_9STRA|nr:nardilysinlike protein putative [Albugo laibachii Nc14]|eukprot:CCA14855.1 nardilysinlike protein putative [Albugo laibachii Nc14]